jgi:predicted nucleotidyltransferase
MLQKLLGSQARAEILKKLFTGAGQSFYLREFARITGISAPLLSRELRNLASMGLVLIAEDGNRINFTANKAHVLYSVLCELVDKSCGSVELLRKIFADSSADLIFVFGSQAKGTANAQSDIDIFVIGDCGLREITKRLQQISNKITQEINPYVISKAEFQKRLKNDDHFLKEILNTPKIFLKGGADEFAAMAK